MQWTLSLHRRRTAVEPVLDRVVDEAATTAVALAPHGGYIEYGTDFEARRVAEEADGVIEALGTLAD